MDLTNLENALNNGNFKEQVYFSLEGVYQISKVLNQLDLLKNSLEAKKQELEARLNMELQSARASEIQKLNDTGNALKTQLIAELTQLKATNSKRNEVFRDLCLW